MSVKAFRNYWENIYGPLIAKIPGLVKYIQYHVHSDSLDTMDDSIDGIAELWFASEETQKTAWQSSEYLAVAKDEENLFEMNNHFVHPVMTDKIVIVKERGANA